MIDFDSHFFKVEIPWAAGDAYPSMMSFQDGQTGLFFGIGFHHEHSSLMRVSSCCKAYIQKGMMFSTVVRTPAGARLDSQNFYCRACASPMAFSAGMMKSFAESLGDARSWLENLCCMLTSLDVLSTHIYVELILSRLVAVEELASAAWREDDLFVTGSRDRLREEFDYLSHVAGKPLGMASVG